MTKEHKAVKRIKSMRVILKQSCLKENYQVHFALIVGRFCEFSACGGYQYCLILKQ